jgi:hypothetical protein
MAGLSNHSQAFLSGAIRKQKGFGVAEILQELHCSLRSNTNKNKAFSSFVKCPCYPTPLGSLLSGGTPKWFIREVMLPSAGGQCRVSDAADADGVGPRQRNGDGHSSTWWSGGSHR